MRYVQVVHGREGVDDSSQEVEDFVRGEGSSSSSRRRWKSTTSMTNNSWKGISVDSLDDDDADVDEVEGEAGESYRREHFRFRS
mmetsp:Transcript_17253/g.35905  ORF Transcript_17253/g.35905 Transcript_17253/m.35905 type:complete len:84 (-) Transcript_17253:350-601(-)